MSVLVPPNVILALRRLFMSALTGVIHLGWRILPESVLVLIKCGVEIFDSWGSGDF